MRLRPSRCSRNCVREHGFGCSTRVPRVPVPGTRYRTDDTSCTMISLTKCGTRVSIPGYSTRVLPGEKSKFTYPGYLYTGTGTRRGTPEYRRTVALGVVALRDARRSGVRAAHNATRCCTGRCVIPWRRQHDMTFIGRRRRSGRAANLHQSEGVRVCIPGTRVLYPDTTL